MVNGNIGYGIILSLDDIYNLYNKINIEDRTQIKMSEDNVQDSFYKFVLEETNIIVDLFNNVIYNKNGIGFYMNGNNCVFDKEYPIFFGWQSKYGGKCNNRSHIEIFDMIMESEKNNIIKIVASIYPKYVDECNYYILTNYCNCCEKIEI